MRFNKSSQADEVMKSYVKRKAGKAARAAGKKAAHAVSLAAKKAFLYATGLIGLPCVLLIIMFSCLALMLPMSGFTGTGGVDETNPAFAGEGIDFSAFAGMERETEAELTRRARQLSVGAFWDDMFSFFGGGFKDSQTKFKTEYADAAFYDEEGNEELTMYSSTFNRLVAIINESFRASLRDSNVLKLGEEEAKRHEEEYKKECEEKFKPDPTRYPSSENETYNIIEKPTDMKIERDPALDDTNYILESCYVISASSVKDTFDSLGEGQVEYKNAVKNALDLAFNLTGMGNAGTNREIVWRFSVTSEYEEEYTEGETRYEYRTIPHYYYNGNEIDSQTYWEIRNSGKPKDVDLLSTNEEQVVTHTYHDIYYQRHILATYTAFIKENFRELVLNDVGFAQEDANRPSYDMSARELIETQSLEFRKLYALGGEDASIEDMGLPLPNHSYSISSGYGRRAGFRGAHKGLDLAAQAGTPIYAIDDGVVERIYWGGGGHSIKVKLASGYTLVCYHMNISSDNYVSVGQEITKGTQIGSVGTTFDAALGGASTGNHLHLEIQNEAGVAVPLDTENREFIRNASNNPDSLEWDRDFE